MLIGEPATNTPHHPSMTADKFGEHSLVASIGQEALEQVPVGEVGWPAELPAEKIEDSVHASIVSGNRLARAGKVTVGCTTPP